MLCHARFARSALAICLSVSSLVAYAESETTTEGVIFRCAPLELEVVQAEMSDYLLRLGIRSDWVTTTVTTGTQVQFTLATVAHDTNTLSLASQENYGIKNDIVMLPNKKGGLNAVSTVSQKEIVLALFQRGRVTTFEGAACSLATFKDHVGIRQNIVSWAQKLDWGWPNGGSARWNSAYWLKGTPNTAVSPFVALHDAFLQQHAYAIGCYTASKLVIAHAVSDYYRRIKRDPGLTRLVEQRLLSDGEPLVDIEPGKMWSFEADFEAAELNREGKLLHLQEKVAPTNFVPGDWAYFLNTDAKSYQQTGYEGSNAIYLGGNKFDDYYNDNHHHYTYHEKMEEVYQWRHGVFSRRRDAAKREVMTKNTFERLGKTPEEGGLLLAYRAVPLLFTLETPLQLERGVRESITKE